MLVSNTISKLALIVLGLFVMQNIFAQGVRYHSEDAMEGYTLYESRFSSSAVLIDNCGRIVNEWNQVAATHHPKLLPNGNIVYIQSFNRNIIEKDWDDNIINNLSINSDDIRLDYEVIVMGNGNYLCLARKNFSKTEFEALGFNYGNPINTTGVGRPSQVDMVVEIDRNTGDIVWQWNIADHVIQERDASAGNYGIVANHPELLNMDAIATYDWTTQESFMINGFDYNSELDQIVLSIRKISEIAIIDHSTTTEEAAGHTGGNAGKGGDILYRWGNPQNYGKGDWLDRDLYFQHNPNWIQHGPLKGNIIMFNNGLTRLDGTYSSVPIINTQVDANGNYSVQSNGAYGPDVPDVNYAPTFEGLGDYYYYSEYTSAAKILANGNILITVGGDHETFEMTPDGTLVWMYDLYQPDLTFRVEKYALDYPAFEGRDLTPGETLEFPPSDIACTLVDVSDTYFDKSQVWISDNQLRLTTDLTGVLSLRVYTIDGKVLLTKVVEGNQSIDIGDFSEGIYFINLSTEKSKSSITYKVIK